MIRGLVVLWLLMLSCFTANADVYRTKFNPYTGKMDYVNRMFVSVPSTPSAACELNTIAEDDNYLYICVGTNTWMRTILVTWAVAEGWLLAEPDTWLLVEPDTYLRTQ